MCLRLLLITILACALCGGSLAAQAAGADFNQGVAYYNQRRFAEALPYLQRAHMTDPGDSAALYYTALTFHRLGDLKSAAAVYQAVVERFPGSQAGANSEAALKRLQPPARRPDSPGSGPTAGAERAGSSAADLASLLRAMGYGEQSQGEFVNLPETSKVYFERKGNSLIVDAEINNRRIPMVFDTGAEATVLGANHLRQLGIKPPEGSPTGLAQGVGSSRPVPTWHMSTTIKVGSIVKKGFPITVQEALPTEPLLGQSFFKDFEYTIDNGARSIVFHRRSTGGTRQALAGVRDPYAVPFRRDGDELIVNVEVNGRSIPMYFDTGAESIALSPEHVKQLGLSIPEDAEIGYHIGIGGRSKGYHFDVKRIRMGPIDKSDVPISVVETSAMRYPLLGQTLYKDWQYTIDNKNNIIKFVRR